MEKIKTLVLVLVVLFVQGRSEEFRFFNPIVVLGGLDVGAHEINNQRNLSFSLNGGVEGPKNVFFGGQFASNREWNFSADPNEYEFEINGQAGKIFTFQNTYLRACIGVGYAHGVRRGEYIPDSDNKYKVEYSNEMGFPFELSMGFLKEIGIGLKIKGWAGRNPYSGLMVEFLGKRETSRN